jgi:hypothetical protein
MKHQTKWLATGLAIAGSLIAANTLKAQSIMDFSTMDVNSFGMGTNALYGNWGSIGTVAATPTGFEVNSGGYGSSFYSIPSAQTVILNPLDTQVTLTFTMNSNPANYIWAGTPFILDDNGGNSVTYGGYSGDGNPGNPVGTTWNGNVVTMTAALTGAQLADIQAGGDYINGFNFEFDPAVVTGPPIYDVTYNSIVLSPAPVPEPGTIALAGLAAAGWVAWRRKFRF